MESGTSRASHSRPQAIFSYKPSQKNMELGVIIPRTDEKTGLRGFGCLRNFLQLVSGRAGD